MRKLRNKEQDSDGTDEPILANDDGTINGEVYGARLSSLLEEIDPTFELEPEAEELVLRMTDDFVDRVTRRSAEYAKHRESRTLDAVDVQLCLEKHWDITIPGLPSQRPTHAPWAYRRPQHDEKKTKKRKTTLATA